MGKNKYTSTRSTSRHKKMHTINNQTARSVSNTGAPPRHQMGAINAKNRLRRITHKGVRFPSHILRPENRSVVNLKDLTAMESKVGAPRLRAQRCYKNIDIKSSIHSATGNINMSRTTTKVRVRVQQVSHRSS